VSLRTRFLIYLTIVHLVFFAGAVFFLRENRLWLFAVEAFFIVSLVTGVVLVRKLFEPLRLIRSGIDFIKASEFATRFREVGQKDLDPLIQVYNRMADSLREQRIHNEEQDVFLQRVIASSPSGIVVLDLDGRVAMANESAASLLQFDRKKILGQKLEDLDSRIATEVAGLDQDETRMLSLRGPRRVKCRTLSFMDRGFARRFVLLEELTEELYRTEKAAYEKLIRMMSHEVNNTTSAVNSLLDSCLHYRDQISEADRDDFARALGIAIGRSGRMNQFMREFAEVVRLPAPSPQPTDLKRLLEDVVFLLQQQNDHDRVDWVMDVPGGLPPVSLDPAQMEQVFINIFKNAMESVGNNGVITVGIELRNGKTVVRVGDTGDGISDDVRPHLFTPFYSSKKDGRGIGLTVVREVLLRHGFDFSLENGQSGGAEFTIIF
jgi:nitrogen fixation/metabolism regulation signal transduction histidine kinase